jgi:hypothetical protein
MCCSLQPHLVKRRGTYRQTNHSSEESSSEREVVVLAEYRCMPHCSVLCIGWLVGRGPRQI